LAGVSITLKHFPIQTYIDKSEAGGLWSDQAATPVATFTGQDTFPQFCLLFVAAKHPTNFSWRNTNITSRNVNVGTDVLAQFGHEGDTELSNLAIGFPFRVEVGATFASTHVHYFFSVRIASQSN
jgi:hypothetical protein